MIKLEENKGTSLKVSRRARAQTGATGEIETKLLEVKKEKKNAASPGTMIEAKVTAENSQLHRTVCRLRNGIVAKERRKEHAVMKNNLKEIMQVKGIITLVMRGRMCSEISHQMNGQGRRKHKIIMTKRVVDDQENLNTLGDVGVVPVDQAPKKNRLLQEKKENKGVLGVLLRRNAPRNSNSLLEMCKIEGVGGPLQAPNKNK